MRRASTYRTRGLAAALACFQALLGGCELTPPRPGPTTAPRANVADLQRQVADTERAFAKTMASRDHAAFAAFLSAEAVFFTGPKPLHGSQQVADGWKRFYDGAAAPFSWEPKEVEVLDSGTLALSSGPVHDPSGKLIATYTSIWRLEAPGVWRIIFDKGNPACDCAKAP